MQVEEGLRLALRALLHGQSDSSSADDALHRTKRE